MFRIVVLNLVYLLCKEIGCKRIAYWFQDNEVITYLLNEKTMEREELLELVQQELGDTQLTLSERTINGELDDSLSDFGDDADANAKAVTRIANRLKRLDGQLHADVAEQVSVYKKSLKGRVDKPKVDKKVEGQEPSDPTISDLMKRIEAIEAAAKEKEKALALQGVKDNVKNRLSEKFRAAGIEVNDFFLGTALSRLDISPESTDIDALVKKAEENYNVDRKLAGFEASGRPNFGGQSGLERTSASDYFARKAKKEGWGKK